MTKATRLLWQTALSKALSGVNAKYVTVEFEVDGKTAEVKVKPDDILNNMKSGLKVSDYLRCEHIFRVKSRGEVLFEYISEKRAKQLTVKADGKLYFNDIQIGSSKKCLVFVEGNLALNDTPITTLPDNLMISGSLRLNNTPITSLPDKLVVVWDIEMRHTPITSLPDNLTTIGGTLELSYSQITVLPDKLTTIGGCLRLKHTPIASLPDGLAVSELIDIKHTNISVLPNNLVVGWYIDIRGTSITSLPETLVARDGVFDVINRPSNTLQNGDYVPGRYLYADGRLTHVKSVKTVGKYTLYIGKIEGFNVVYDGEYYSRCKNMQAGISDILFKRAKNRGAEQYKDLTLDSTLTVEEATAMYRIITGACKESIEQFIDSQEKLRKKYSIREFIELTKGQYNSERFAEFFGTN